MSDVTTKATDTVTLTIDGRELTAPKDTLLIEACRNAGIEVPAFCYYPGLSLQAACRMCLVRIEKIPKLATACTTVVMDGMVVSTDTEEIHLARKSMLEFLLTNHPLDCPVCDKGGECELQDMVFRYGAAESRFAEEKEHQPEQQFSPVVYFDYGRCILCFRCVRVCDEGMDVKALGVGHRGVRSVIMPNNPAGTLDCEECGMCVDICPVGALTSQQYRYKTRPWELTYVPTPCAHCGDGCKTTLSIRNNRIQRGSNRDRTGINGEFLCIKGRYAGDFTHHVERLRYPMVRRGGELTPCSWEDAIDAVATRLQRVIEDHGPLSAGIIGSNRTSNEENYALSRFARAVVGTNNIDHHRTADYSALVSALSSRPDAHGTVSDLERAGAILLVGNDPTHNHPLMAWKIREAVRHRQTPVYIVNARPIKIGRQASAFIRIDPGTEPEAIQTLLDGTGKLPDDQKKGIAGLRDSLQKVSDVVILFGAELSGPSVAGLVEFGQRLQGQTRYIALGDYCNSRGASDMGLLPHRLPGYSLVEDEDARNRWNALWKCSIPEKPGLDARAMLSGGNLRALYVVGANPLRTFGLEPSRESLGPLDLVVVHELFLTETAQCADIVLPVASAYEKAGTMTNTCGEVQAMRPALEPGEVRTDLDILRLISHRMRKPIHFTGPDAVFEEIRKNVFGYEIAVTDLIAGHAIPARPADGVGAAPQFDPTVFSSDDSLFTSGTLGRYSLTLNSVEERKKPRE